MKTIKQIADELGVGKQRVYRYIKSNHISDAHQKNGMMYYDATAEMAIKQGLNQSVTSNDAHQKHIKETVNEAVINLLRNELEAKNMQIEHLQSELADERKHSREQADKLAVLADTAQKLHAGTIKQLDVGELPLDGRTVPVEADEKNKKNGFMARIFKKEKTG